MLLAVSFLLAGITGVIKMPGWFSINPSIMIPLMKIHDWSGMVMVALVLVHLIQHWKWIVVMSKRIFIKNEKVKRISFLVLVMILTAVLSLSAYSITSNIKQKQHTSTDSQNSTKTIDQQSNSYNQPVIRTGGCPFGIQEDVFPGQCGLYTDKNNNGECDYGE